MAHVNFIHSFDDFLKLPPNTKNMEFDNGRDDNHAWKLHIVLDQDNITVSNPVIKDTAKFLIEHNICFKMGNGGDGGKVFTAYIGEYNKVQRVAERLNSLFGNRYKENYPQGGINLPEDRFVFHNIGIRFEGVKDSWGVPNRDSVFSYYGYAGVPSLDKHLHFNGMNDWQLSALACHIFLAEKCGANYLGSHYKQNPWANKIFENLPTKYTSQQIQDYVSSAVAFLKATHQERFIYSKNLVPPEQGISLSVHDIIPAFQSNNEINLNVNNLEIMPSANRITIHQNKFGNHILEYRQGGKLLASCSLDGEEHLVRLYSDDGSFQEYMTSPKQRTKQFKNNMLYPLVSSSLECHIDSIVSLSSAIGKRELAKRRRSIPTKTAHSSEGR